MDRLLLVEDDANAASIYVSALAAHGFDTTVATTVDAALAAIDTENFAVVLTDIMMPTGGPFSDEQTQNGLLTGIHLAHEIRKRNGTAKVCAFSLRCDLESTSGPFDRYFQKLEWPPHELAKEIRNLLTPRGPCVFIVHGHDKELLLDAKDFIQNSLHYPEPIVLAQQPSKGHTIIEKFETHAQKADVVFVLISPDDSAAPKTSRAARSDRPRQNVIFEYGYFLGVLRRKSGRVLLLYKGNCELPSDIAGVIYIDVTNGVRSAAEEIRTELKAMGY